MAKKAGTKETARVAVVGRHPAAFVAAHRLATAGIEVVHLASKPTAADDRLVTINPQTLDMLNLSELPQSTSFNSVRFLGDGGATAVTTDAFAAEKPPMVASLRTIAEALAARAEEAGVRRASGEVTVEAIDDAAGVSLKVGNEKLHVSLVIASDGLSAGVAEAMGVPAAADDASQRHERLDIALSEEVPTSAAASISTRPGRGVSLFQAKTGIRRRSTPRPDTPCEQCGSGRSVWGSR